ncbi:MAG: hypothetical protein ACI4CY_04455 [Candidatus Gastranaerophilaceae bacterium]
MKKILLIYSDSLVLNIPLSGNILTAHPGYLYLTVLQNAISEINFYTLKTLKLLINDLAKLLPLPEVLDSLRSKVPESPAVFENANF